VIASLVVHAVLVFLLVTGVRSRTVLSFCMAWYFATFAIASNLLFSIGTFMNERFMYVASVAFCVLLAWALARRASNRAAVVAVSVLVIVAGSATTFARNFAWKDDRTLALTDVQISRGSARAQLAAGLAYVDMAQHEVDPKRKTKELAAAIDHLTASVRIVGSFLSISSLGSAYTQSGRYAEALQYYEEALRVKPAEADVMNNVQYIAEQATEQKDFDVALRAYRVLIAQKPSGAWYAALGRIYGKDLGDLAKAEEALVQGVRIEPNNASLMERLGIIYAMSGRTSEALERFEQASALDPANSGLYRNKEMALRQLGRVDEAETAMRKAAQLDGALD
jgi:tetratricopeptide (TPR) repeat protein